MEIENIKMVAKRIKGALVRHPEHQEISLKGNFYQDVCTLVDLIVDDKCPMAEKDVTAPPGKLVKKDIDSPLGTLITF